MKKAVLLSFLAFTFLAQGQPITKISTLKANTSSYLHQGFFMEATVDSAVGATLWMVHDNSGNIICDFINVNPPSANAKVTIVGKGKTDNGFKVDVSFYYPTAAPPNIKMTVVDAVTKTADGDPVHISGAITGILSAINADYFFEDATGTVEADFDLQMNVPDLYLDVELWGIIDNPSPGYLDIDVWAWYVLSAADIAENQASFSLFPNPASTEIEINTPTEITTVKLFDATGRLVLEEQIDSNLRVDVSKLSNGNYIVSFLKEGQLMGQSKLVILRN